MTTPRRAALVFAGGASRRMGRDKCGLSFGPETMLERVVRLVAPSVDEVVVVARAGQAVPAGARAAFDRDSFEGPLAALLTGMIGSEADQFFVVGCDQPLLQPALIPVLFQQLGAAHAALPLIGGRLIPTCAAYRRSILGFAQALLATGERRLAALAEHIGAIQVDEGLLRTVDPDLLSFLPCNTPREYERLLELGGVDPQERVP